MSAMCLEFMPFDSAYHAPVLAAEIVGLLGGRRRVLDCTLGGGGHSLALLQKGVASVTGIDRDAEALKAAGERLEPFAATGRFAAFQANYADLDQHPDLAAERFDGILLDLGISSHQIDATERGFSFRPGAPLDMRMGRADGVAVDAAVLLNTADEGVLASIFRDYGDETRAMRLAREILKRRRSRLFETS